MNIYSIAVVTVKDNQSMIGAMAARASTEAEALVKLQDHYRGLGRVIIEYIIIDVTEEVYKWVKDIDAEEWVWEK